MKSKIQTKPSLKIKISVMSTSRQSSYETVADESLQSDVLEVSLANLSLSESDCEVGVGIAIDCFTAASIGCKDYFVRAKDYNINTRNKGGWNALMYASYYGHSKVVETIVKNGANLEIANNSGCTALMLAAMCGKEEICRVLLSSGANVETTDHKEWNALFYSVYFNHSNVVSLLLEYGADPNVKESFHGLTPLILAVYGGLELCVQRLLQSNADFTVRLHTGECAREIAQDIGHGKIIQLIDEAAFKKRAKYSPNIRDGPKTLARLAAKTRPCSKKEITEVKDLYSLLQTFGVEKYYSVFSEQDVDLDVFLTLTDNDLKEIGIVLLGPRRKMTSAIARWHSSAPLKSSLEETYANKLEADMQELGIALEKAALKVEELEKDLDQEKNMRKIMEECLLEEKSFAQNVFQLGIRTNNSIQKIQNDYALAEKHLSSLKQKKLLSCDFISTSMRNICLESNMLENNLRQLLSMAEDRVEFLEKKHVNE